MGQVKAIHQIAPAFLYGDAVGNQILRFREILRQAGYPSQVYAQYRDQRWADPGLDYTRYRGHPDHLLIFHYAIGSAVTDFVRHLPDTLIPYYHNVTPPEFVGNYNPGFARALEQGRRELALLKDAPVAMAASEYNRREMLALGFKQVHVLPYFVYMDELLASAESPAGRAVAARLSDGWVNLLFVGRIVPNKRQDDLIRAFRYYHQLINPRSRLILVGSTTNTPGYQIELETLAEMFDLDHVCLEGPVGLREGLGGYYKAATVFLCLSEHEGFCVPLLEAMRFDVPVIAFKSTGVPDAMNGAGILVSQKRYDVIGELIDRVTHDADLRRRIIERQRARLAELAPERVAAQLRELLPQLVQLASDRTV